MTGSMMALAILVQAPCPAVAPPPVGLEAWSRRASIDAAADVARAPVLRVGTAVEARLRPAATLRPAVAPERAAAAGSYGGIVAIEVPRAGRYRVALGGPAWVEVARAGRRVASVAHGHGPECSGIRKIVAFDLTPGRHAVQVTGSATPTVALMVAPLP